MLQVGSLVDGKYKILSQVGKGGMSVVYMAINERANKTWAVKEVRKDGVMDFESVRQGLVAETDILKNLSHPYLPSIVDVIDMDDSFIIIMDYIQGRSLKAVLDDYGAQDESLVIEWAKQLCDVLGYLHSRKPAIIYRDMKPANVMLRPDGNITLIDFGIAREYKEQNVADTSYLGTRGYAAPEQFGGKGQTDGRTDIYCLGVTLYHLVTGRNPSEPPYEILPIREVNPALSAGLERIIMKCTQPNPDDRYQSAAELMYDLEHFEEISDQYRKKQKRKVFAFGGLIAAAAACLVAGLVLKSQASKKAEASYEALVLQAEMSSDNDTKKELYREAILVPEMDGREEAYLGLIDADRLDDGAFTVSEVQTLEKAISDHRESLLSNPEAYVKICFEMGKTIWYYYSYGDENEVTRAVNAVSWFEEVKAYADPSYEKLNMAAVYSLVGRFYRDIDIKVTEGEDRGSYGEFFGNLRSLVSTVAEDENETDVVRLRLLKLSENAIFQYATKFKADDVPEEDVDAVLKTVEDSANAIVIPDSDTMTGIMKAGILSNLQATKDTVKAAYETRKEK